MRSVPQLQLLQALPPRRNRQSLKRRRHLVPEQCNYRSFLKLGYSCEDVAHLFHNPHRIKRPQAKSSTVKRPTAPKPMMSSSSSDAPAVSQQPGLDFWRSTAEDDAAIIEAKREENRRRKQEKKDAKNFRKHFGDYRPGENYKLARDSNIKAFKATGGDIDMIDEWESIWQKDVEEADRRKKGVTSSDDSSEPRSRGASHSSSDSPVAPANPMFAPPSFDEPSTSSPSAAPMAQSSAETDTSPPPAAAPVAQTAEDAFQHRLRLAQQIAASIKAAPPPPPPPPVEPPPNTQDAPPPPPPPSSNSMTISAPPVHYGATLSAPPVHYARPDSGSKVDNSANDRPAKKQKTNEPKPKKLSYGARLMSKMGYVEGQGLGKNNDGVTTHLEVKARKDSNNRQMRDEFEDTKTGKTQQVFDITGGLRAQKQDHGPFGEPSRVVVTWGCVDGVDFTADADRDDGGIRQEMGDAFNTKFGNINRIHVNTDGGDSIAVYIQFNDPLSALNAVNRFHEGYTFQDRKIRAQFYNEPKFNAFIFDH